LSFTAIIFTTSSIK